MSEAGAFSMAITKTCLMAGRALADCAKRQMPASNARAASQAQPFALKVDLRLDVLLSVIRGISEFRRA